MIRVNLLAQKRETRSSEGDQRWVGVLIGVLAVEAIVLFVLFQSKRDELAVQVRTNAEIKSQIDQIKRATSNQADIKAQLEALRARKEAIEKLQSARTGPTAMFLELGQLLTPGRGPTADPDMLAQLRRDNPINMYNSAWDPRRLWLTSLSENDRLIRLEGLARDGDDVSELARRLGLSIYFADVRLLPGTRTTEGGGGKVDLIKFQLQAKVRY